MGAGHLTCPGWDRAQRIPRSPARRKPGSRAAIWQTPPHQRWGQDELPCANRVDPYLADDHQACELQTGGSLAEFPYAPHRPKCGIHGNARRRRRSPRSPRAPDPFRPAQTLRAETNLQTWGKKEVWRCGFPGENRMSYIGHPSVRILVASSISSGRKECAGRFGKEHAG